MTAHLVAPVIEVDEEAIIKQFFFDDLTARRQLTLQVERAHQLGTSLIGTGNILTALDSRFPAESYLGRTIEKLPTEDEVRELVESIRGLRTQVEDLDRRRIALKI